MAERWRETAPELSNSAITVPASNRRGLIIGNPSDTVMTFRVNGTAAADVGVPIPAGTAVNLSGPNCPAGSISVFCAGAAKKVTIYEWP